MLLQNNVLHPNTSSLNNRTESYELGESRSKAKLEGMSTAKNLKVALLHLILDPPPPLHWLKFRKSWSVL